MPSFATLGQAALRMTILGELEKRDTLTQEPFQASMRQFASSLADLDGRSARPHTGVNEEEHRNQS